MAMEYHFNLPEYLAKCVNLSQRQLACNGQCVLMQKIAEKEQGESKNNLVMYEYSSLYVHKDYVVFSMRQPHSEITKLELPPYLAGYAYEYDALVFRPPIA